MNEKRVPLSFTTEPVPFRGLSWEPVPNEAPSVLAVGPAGKYSATPNTDEDAPAPWTAWFKQTGSSSWRFLGYAADAADARELCEKAEAERTIGIAR